MLSAFDEGPGSQYTVILQYVLLSLLFRKLKLLNFYVISLSGYIGYNLI